MKRMKPFQKNPAARIQLAALVIVTLSLIFLMILPAGPTFAQDDPTPQTGEAIDLATPSPTPIPQEWADNREQTTGIIAGAVVLAVIIIGGTLHTIDQNKQQKK
jgi:hypothetical protein